VIGFFVAAVVVTLLQYLRLHDRRLLPLLGLFVFLALAHFRGEWDFWGRHFHFAAGLCGLILLAMLSRTRAS
jgi:hypothetical protein